ncbi:MAG: polysaccharide deacetylase family protein [Polyangiaceae bacterium]
MATQHSLERTPAAAGAAGRLSTFSICYHTVSDKPLPHVLPLYPYKTEEAFTRDMRALQRRCDFLSYDAFVERRTSKRTTGRPGVLLTFDDGLSECYTIVRPILKKLGIPCVFFVTTGFLDNRAMFYRGKAALCVDRLQGLSEAKARDCVRACSETFGWEFPDRFALMRWLLSLHGRHEFRLDAACEVVGVDVEAYLRTRRPFMTTEQVCTLHGEGFTIGAHTVFHPKLALQTRARAKREIVDSCRTVSALTGASDVPFAFPFSGDGIERTFLAEIRARHRFVGLLFDIFGHAEPEAGRRKDRAFIVQRLACDTNAFARKGRSNMGALLVAGYGSGVTGM